MPTPAGVVVEKESKYILAHTGLRELNSTPWEGVGWGSNLVQFSVIIPFQ